MRDPRVYLEDMLDAIRRVKSYTRAKSFEDFQSDEIVVDAVVRNLEVLGEAAKQLPDDLKSSQPDVEWRKIVGLRDVLIHQYFGVHLVLGIVWEVVQAKIPPLEAAIGQILRSLPDSQE